MSYLLEMLGRGMLGRLHGAFDKVLGGANDAPLEVLERAVEDDPRDVAARILLGGAYLRADDPTAARDLFRDLLADHDDASVRIGYACALDDLARSEEALEQFRLVQKQDPTNPAILFCTGFCHERAGRETEAVNYYQDAISICPTLRNAHERLGAIFLKQDQVELAVHHYDQLCRLDPEKIDVHLTLANLLLRTGDYNRAIQRYQHAIALEPDNWTAHNDAVAAYEEAGLFREAIEHLHKMIEKQPDFADARVRLGDLYARIANDDAATAQYEKAVELSPGYLEANIRLATQHLRAGRHTEAARWFAYSLELNDRLLSAYVGMGVAQQAGGRSEESMASFEMARQVEPNSTLLFSEIARMQLKAAASEQASRFLNLSIDGLDGASGAESAETDSDAAASPPCEDLIGRVIERHQRAVRERPNHADLHYRLGLLLRNRGRIDDAIASFETAVAINPSYMKALIKLGLALKEADRIDEAVAAFEQAADLHPEYLDLHYQLGLLFSQNHQFEIALEHFERAVDGNPQNVDFQTNLALALQNMGLIDRARATWEIVCELAPDSEWSEAARAATASQRDAGR